MTDPTNPHYSLWENGSKVPCFCEQTKNHPQSETLVNAETLQEKQERVADAIGTVFQPDYYDGVDRDAQLAAAAAVLNVLGLDK